MLFKRAVVAVIPRAAAPAEDTPVLAMTELEAVYRELGPYAISKTAYLVGSADIAEEIVQEVFLKLWQKRLSFPTRRQAYAWVYTACHNAGVDHLRAHRRHSARLAHEVPLTLRAPDSPADRVANRDALASLFARLDERDARIVAYRFIDGAELEDIAGRMAISAKTVQRALRRVSGMVSTDFGLGFAASEYLRREQAGSDDGYRDRVDSEAAGAKIDRYPVGRVGLRLSFITDRFWLGAYRESTLRPRGPNPPEPTPTTWNTVGVAVSI